MLWPDINKTWWCLSQSCINNLLTIPAVHQPKGRFHCELDYSQTIFIHNFYEHIYTETLHETSPRWFRPYKPRPGLYRMVFNCWQIRGLTRNSAHAARCMKARLWICGRQRAITLHSGSTGWQNKHITHISEQRDHWPGDENTRMHNSPRLDGVQPAFELRIRIRIL